MPIYFPKTSSEKHRAVFRRLAETQAEFIRNGGLWITRPITHPNMRWAQVHKTAYESLALINQAGLLTYDSQDSVNAYTGRVKSSERCYIQGIMLPDDALTFVNNINIWNDDKVAIICMELPKYPRYGAEIAVTRAFDAASQTWIGSRTMDAFTFPDWIDIIRDTLKVPKRIKFSVVQVFDTKWGRPARSKKGLFNAVLRALDPTTVYPDIKGGLITFIMRGKPDDEERFEEWKASFQRKRDM